MIDAGVGQPLSSEEVKIREAADQAYKELEGEFDSPRHGPPRSCSPRCARERARCRFRLWPSPSFLV